MSAQAVTWTKIVITGVPGMECVIPVTPDGRASDPEGEPLPLELRTRKCGGDGIWAVGAAFVCREHAAEVARMMDDSIEAIDAAWREECL